MLNKLETWLGDLLNPGTTEIRVAKPWCTPARPIILSALQPYHVKVVSTSERIIRDLDGNNLYIEASVRVRRKQAEWAEYLLLRSNRFQLVSRPINPRNIQWAQKYAGKMPTPWDIAIGRATPWQEPGCKGQATCKIAQAKRQQREKQQRKRPTRARRRPRTRRRNK